MITTIKEWKNSNLILEKKQDIKKDLIIVDVQSEFNKFFNDKYLVELKKYCNQFGRVYQVWDTTKAKDPSYIWPNQVISYDKKYGGKLDLKDVDNFFDPDTAEEVKKEWNNKKEGWHKVTKYGDLWLYVNGSHEWFNASEELLNFVKRLGKTDREVVLVGGAGPSSSNKKGECLYDLEILLKTFNVNYTREDLYVYSAEGCRFKEKEVVKEALQNNSISIKDSLEFYKVNGWEDISNYIKGNISEEPGYADNWNEIKIHIENIKKAFKPSSTNFTVWRKSNHKEFNNYEGFISATLDRKQLSNIDFIAYKKNIHKN